MIKLLKEELKIIEKIEKITNENYGVTEDGYISDYDVMCALENMVDEYENVFEKFSEFVKDVDDNYKRLTIEDQIN